MVNYFKQIEKSFKGMENSKIGKYAIESSKYLNTNQYFGNYLGKIFLVLSYLLLILLSYNYIGEAINFMNESLNSEWMTGWTKTRLITATIVTIPINLIAIIFIFTFVKEISNVFHEVTFESLIQFIFYTFIPIIIIFIGKTFVVVIINNGVNILVDSILSVQTSTFLNFPFLNVFNFLTNFLYSSGNNYFNQVLFGGIIAGGIMSLLISFIVLTIVNLLLEFYKYLLNLYKNMFFWLRDSFDLISKGNVATAIVFGIILYVLTAFEVSIFSLFRDLF